MPPPVCEGLQEDLKYASIAHTADEFWALLQAKAAPDSIQLEALQRDNAILKRAVAIQNSRLQEMAGREAEVTQLRAVAKVSTPGLQMGYC
jgi:hypothetical protein